MVRRKRRNKQNRQTMATTQITFTAEQIGYLREWLEGQSRQYVSTVMGDDFGDEEASEEDFASLCRATFNVDGFKQGEVVGRERGSTTKGGKQKRKAKDPAAPKRPKSAYMCWLWPKGMDDVKAANPDMVHKDRVQRAAQLWREMSEADKEPWEKMSADAKKEYADKMKEYAGSSASASEGEEDDTSVECPDGFELRKGMFLGGYSSAGKTRYDSLDDAVSAMNGVDDAGGIVYDGKNYTIRKNGNPRVSQKSELLYLKL